jgi:hypothetical protein
MKQIRRFLSFMFFAVILLSSASVNAQIYTANDDNITTALNTPVIIHVRANDTYPFQYQTVDFGFFAPTHGSIEFIGDDILYTPTLGYTGTDEFMYALRINGAAMADSALVMINVSADTDPNFHLNMVGITPATCTGGQLKVFMKNGTAPYLYQINGSVVSTTLADSIIVNNFVSHTGTIQVTDANSITVNDTFTIPNNSRLLCLDGPMSGYTYPNQCVGNASVGVWGGTPPFVAVGASIMGPEQYVFDWEGNDSHSRRAYVSGVCQGMYNLIITDSNNLQATGSFFIDTNSTSFPTVVSSSIDTCIAIASYLSAYVSDVYTDGTGTYATWEIIVAVGDTITLNVHYNISAVGTYQFILYVNCPNKKSTVTLTSIFSVFSSDLIMSITENQGFANAVAYPNPLTDKAMVRFTMNRSCTVDINVLNIIGESVAHYSVNTIPGNNAIAIDVNHLTKGTYIIQLMDDQRNRMNIKVVK